MIIADSAALAISFFLAYWLRTDLSFFGPQPPLRDYVRALTFILPTFLAWQTVFGLYRSALLYQVRWLLWSITKAWFVSMLTVASILYMGKEMALSRFVLETFALVSLMTLASARFGLRSLLKRGAQRSRDRRRWEVLLVAELAEAEAYLSLLRAHPHWGIEVAAIVSPTQGFALESVSAVGRGNERVSRRRVDWRRVLDSQVIDEVVAVAEWSDQSQLIDLQQLCAARGLVFSVLVILPYPKVGKYNVEDAGGGRYLVSLETVPRDLGPLAVKRLIDIMGALAGLLVCAILLPWYAYRLRRESPGRIFIAQPRSGRNGRPFRRYKFRTFAVGTERQAKELAQRGRSGVGHLRLEDEPRVTPTGGWMRRHYMDELPQFWNVLRGEMSLVGPRPSPVIEAANRFDPRRRRLSMKPGVTGLFQIHRHSSADDFETMVELDCEYVDNWSLVLDLKIILKTLRKVWQGQAG